MPVICAVCQTENRDAAKFCHGCARKLPGFAATGPSLLDAMRPKKRAGSPPEPGPRRALAALPAESRGFWIGLGLLLLAAALAFGGWFAYVTRKVPPPPSSGAAQAVVAPPAPSPRQGDLKGPEPVPLASSLVAGEAEVAADQPAAPAGSAAPTMAPPSAALPRQPSRAATATPRAALDPRRGCENLNFFSAARCEAAHCDQPAYTRHARCDAVREDRRRDEARRNPTLGY